MILFELDLPKGTRGFVGVHDNLTRFASEKEVISIPGFKFEVVEIKKNVTMKGPGTESVGDKVTIVRLRVIPEEN